MSIRNVFGMYKTPRISRKKRWLHFFTREHASKEATLENADAELREPLLVTRNERYLHLPSSSLHHHTLKSYAIAVIG